MAITLDYERFGTTFTNAYGVLTDTRLNNEVLEDATRISATYAVYVSHAAYMADNDPLGYEVREKDILTNDLPQWIINAINSVESQLPL